MEKIASASTPSLTRRVLKAMGMFGGLQMVQIVCGAVRTKLVALWMGAVGVGLFSIFNNAVTMIVALSQLGMRQTAVRDIASAHASDCNDRLGKVAAAIRRWGIWLGTGGLLLTLALSPLLSRETFGSFAFTASFAALGVVVLMQALTSSRQVVMQGTGRLKSLARSTFVGVSGGLVISIPMFLLWGEASIVPSLIAYAAMGLAATGYYFRRDSRDLPYARISRRETWTIGKDFLRLGLYMTGADVAVQVLNYIFVAWLNTAASTSEVGVYQAGYTIVSRYVGMVFTAIGVEYYPRLAGVASRNDRLQVFVAHEMRLLMLILLPVLTVFVPFVPLAVRLLYSSDFAAAVPMIWAALPGMVLRGVSWCMAFVILVKGDGITYLLTEIFSGLTGLCLNVIGYRWGGMLGLGVAFSLWYALFTAVVWVVYRHRYSLRLSPKVVLLSLLTLAAVTAASATACLLWF